MKYLTLLLIFVTGTAYGESWTGIASTTTYELPTKWSKFVSESYETDDNIIFRQSESNTTVNLRINPFNEEADSLPHRLLIEAAFEVFLEPFGKNILNREDITINVFGERQLAVKFEHELENFGIMDIVLSLGVIDKCLWAVTTGVPSNLRGSSIEDNANKIVSSLSFKCPNKKLISDAKNAQNN